MKLVIFDLETSTFGFRANSGFILCCGIKIVGQKKPIMLTRDNMQPDPLNDKKLVKQIYDELSTADMLVGHNSKWFDLPFLNSRLLKWGLAPLPPIPHFDTCDLAYKRLKIKNSLKDIGIYLGCNVQKHDVSFDEWVRAYAGDKKSLAEIVKHCRHDILLTEEVYLKLRPMGFKHPNVGNILSKPHACPLCGKDSLISRGWIYAAVNKSPRFQCNSCGGWSHGKSVKTGIEVRP